VTFALHSRAPTHQASSGSTVVPVVNIAREDFVLRTETVFIFKRLKLDPQGLVFIDDVNLAELHAEQRLELVLVDHNRLGPQQAALEPAIIEILDHHDDQGAYPSGTACDIRPVGSTTTLVAERALAAAAEDDSTSTFVVQLKYAALLLSGILVDTVNLDSSKGRCTEPDVAAAKALTALIDIDNTELFQQLQTGAPHPVSRGAAPLRSAASWRRRAARPSTSCATSAAAGWLVYADARVCVCVCVRARVCCGTGSSQRGHWHPECRRPAPQRLQADRGQRHCGRVCVGRGTPCNILSKAGRRRGALPFAFVPRASPPILLCWFSKVRGVRSGVQARAGSCRLVQTHKKLALSCCLPSPPLNCPTPQAHLKLCARLKLDALVVMTTCHSPTFSRELLVYIASENTKLSSGDV